MSTPDRTKEQENAQDFPWLPAGKTCVDCIWWLRCSVMLGVTELGQEYCDWSPSRFQTREETCTS